MNYEIFLKWVVDFVCDGVNVGVGGFFGVFIVKDGFIIVEGQNNVIISNDLIVYVEVIVIWNVCKVFGIFQFDDCILYMSCELCFMCLGVIYWVWFKVVYYVVEYIDVVEVGFDDLFIYEEIDKFVEERMIFFY